MGAVGGYDSYASEVPSQSGHNNHLDVVSQSTSPVPSSQRSKTKNSMETSPQYITRQRVPSNINNLPSDHPARPHSQGSKDSSYDSRQNQQFEGFDTV
jgi:hypothetical protein